jgi:hypothetical protein
MFVCTLCHFEAPLDDVAVACGAGRGICLRCYARETDTTKPMPKALRQALIAALAALEPTHAT